MTDFEGYILCRAQTSIVHGLLDLFDQLVFGIRVSAEIVQHCTNTNPSGVTTSKDVTCSHAKYTVVVELAGLLLFDVHERAQHIAVIAPAALALVALSSGELAQ